MAGLIWRMFRRSWMPFGLANVRVPLVWTLTTGKGPSQGDRVWTWMFGFEQKCCHSQHNHGGDGSSQKPKVMFDIVHIVAKTLCHN